MPNLEPTLKLKRCPYCSVDNPNLVALTIEFQTTADDKSNPRNWLTYNCKRCGGVVIANCTPHSREVKEFYPKSEQVNEILPYKVKIYLQQAIDSIFSPAGAVMLCASSVDAMLKSFGLIEGSLYNRINLAKENRLITNEMAVWAHQVRLDANDQRHADEETDIPSVDDAKKSIEFAQTLAEFLFVLPSKVTRGIETSRSQLITE